MGYDFQFNVAEGYALLGMQREALMALKEVQLSRRDREIAELLLDLMASTARAWTAGEELARQVQPGDDIKQREAAGRFWLSRAHALCFDQDQHGAKLAVSQMMRIWPEGRQEALDCEGLNGLWC